MSESVRVQKLQVLHEQEAGGDELYLIVEGHRVDVGGHLDTGETRYIGESFGVDYSGVVNVDLYENDAAPNPDDYIAGKDFTSSGHQLHDDFYKDFHDADTSAAYRVWFEFI